jgi:hypothetical protein
MIDPEPRAYGADSLRRANVALVYKNTGNLPPASAYSSAENLRVQYVISASRSTTRWRSPSQSTSQAPRAFQAPDVRKF